MVNTFLRRRGRFLPRSRMPSLSRSAGSEKPLLDALSVPSARRRAVESPGECRRPIVSRTTDIVKVPVRLSLLFSSSFSAGSLGLHVVSHMWKVGGWILSFYRDAEGLATVGSWGNPGSPQALPIGCRKVGAVFGGPDDPEVVGRAAENSQGRPRVKRENRSMCAFVSLHGDHGEISDVGRTQNAALSEAWARRLERRPTRARRRARPRTNSSALRARA